MNRSVTQSNLNPKKIMDLIYHYNFQLHLDCVLFNIALSQFMNLDQDFTTSHDDWSLTIETQEKKTYSFDSVNIPLEGINGLFIKKKIKSMNIKININMYLQIIKMRKILWI